MPTGPSSERIGTELRPLVILTATVTPSAGIPVSISDPDVRRLQYRTAANWWLEKGERHQFDVVLAENSGDVVFDWIPEGVQGLACSQTTSPEFGKGSGEVAMLREVLDVEGRRLASRPWVAKCTGRLKLANLSTLIPSRPFPGIFVSCRPSPSLAQVDARFFIASPEVWTRHLLSHVQGLDDNRGQYFEHSLARGLNSALLADVSFVPFRRVPRFVGNSGTSGLNYNSAKMRIAATLEDVANSARRVGQKYR